MIAVAQKGYYLMIIEKDIEASGELEICEINNEFILNFNIGTTSVSDDMQQEIEEAISMVKKRDFEKYNGNNSIPEWKKGRKWCSNGGDGVEFDYLSLDIDIDRNGITYKINGGFHDVADDLLEAEISIPIDLSRYNGLIKNMVHRYIDDTYFRNC